MSCKFFQFQSVNRFVKNNSCIFFSESGGRRHDQDIVFDGLSVQVVQHHVGGGLGQQVRVRVLVDLFVQERFQELGREEGRALYGGRATTPAVAVAGVGVGTALVFCVPFGFYLAPVVLSLWPI